MFRRLTLIFTLLAALGISRLTAQELEFKSFEFNTRDAAARAHQVTDNNGNPCALLRVFVAVENVDFKGNLGIRGEVRKVRNSEFVMYIPAGSKSIQVQGEGFLPFTYHFNQEIKGLCSYELYLTVPEAGPKKHTIASNYMVMKITPANATVLIDGVMQPQEGGMLSVELPLGRHTYQVAAPQYHSQTGSCEVVASESTRLNIDLKPAFGWLDVQTTTPNTRVMIDGEIKGTAPCRIKLESGSYAMQLVSEGYIAYQQQISIADGMTVPVKTMLKANFAEITIQGPYAHSEIWLRGEKVATGSWSGRLNAGTYAVESRTEGYENCKENIEVAAEVSRTYTLQSPTPIYGMVKINSTPFDATIKLDGKQVGKTPWQSNEVLTGRHTLEISKEGYDTYRETITLTRDAISSINPTLKKETATTSSAGTTTTVTGSSYISSSPISEADKFFPIFDNIILGKTTKEDFQRMGQEIDTSYSPDWVCTMNNWAFWSHDGDGIAESIYTTDTDGMPTEWSALGFDWSLSYNGYIQLFTNWGFSLKKEPIKTETFQKRTCLRTEFTATSKDGSISFRLRFAYGNDHGEGYSTSSRNSLYSMTIKVKQGMVGGNGGSSNLTSNTTATARTSGTALTYDDLFPLYGVSLDKSTQADLRKMGHNVKDMKDGDFVCWINDARFWTFDDDSNIFEQVSISASYLPDPWKEFGFNATLTDEQFAVLLKGLGFQVKWLKKNGKPYVKALSSDEKVLLELEFETSEKFDEITARTRGKNSGFDYVWNTKGDSGSEKTVPNPTSSTTAYNTQSSNTSGTSSSSREKTYKVGDYYNENGKEGVVFWVDGTGKHGKIVSMKESSSKLKWSSEHLSVVASSRTDGKQNLANVKRMSRWETQYPAFAWCTQLGEGWYLPAIDEMSIYLHDSNVHNVVNRTLEQKGGKKISNKGVDYGYWSSTKYDSVNAYRFWMGGGSNLASCMGYKNKTSYYYVRAVATF